MRHIKALITAFMLIIALAPVATATYDCNKTPEGPSFYIPPGIVESDIETLAELQGYCGACGYSTTSPGVGFNAVDASNSIIVNRNNALWEDWNLSAQNNTRYVQRFYNCQGNFVRPSDLSCAGNNFVIAFDVLYREPRSLFECNAGTLPNVTANFTATPTQGTGPLYVSFTDTSTGFPFTWNWSITPATGWLTGPYDLDNEDLTVLFTANGNYTVSHGVNNTQSSDIETKTDYIWIFNSTSTVTTPFTAIDLAFANPINGASISLYDIGNSSWTNGTTGADGKVSITTLEGHLINGYATAAGYDDAELLGVDAYSGGHTFYMYPSGYTNVSSGNVTVFISVVDDSNFGTALSGVTVTGMVGSTTQVGTTDAAGISRFVFPNSTDVHFGATKAGYAGTTVTINTGIPSGGSAAVTGTIHMFRGAVTATPTITGGATTTITVDPYPCVGDGSYQDTLNCQRKQGEMGADLIAYGPDLVNFFIMLTFIGGLALMMKGFR